MSDAAITAWNREKVRLYGEIMTNAVANAFVHLAEQVFAEKDVIAAEARAAERERILVSDETIHADGSIGPDTAPPWGGDAAYWYRRWLFAAKMLDQEGTERISAYVGMRQHLHDVVAEAARAAERESCAQLVESAGPDELRQVGNHAAYYAGKIRARTTT